MIYNCVVLVLRKYIGCLCVLPNIFCIRSYLLKLVNSETVSGHNLKFKSPSGGGFLVATLPSCAKFNFDCFKRLEKSHLNLHCWSMEILVFNFQSCNIHQYTYPINS